MWCLMLLLRKYLSASDEAPEEIQIDDLEFELLTVFLKEYLKSDETHHVEVTRLWGELSNVETAGK